MTFHDERGDAGGLLTSASGHRFGGDGAVGAARVVVPEIRAEVPPLERAAGRHLQRARVALLHIHGRPAALLGWIHCTKLGTRASSLRITAADGDTSGGASLRKS